LTDSSVVGWVVLVGPIVVALGIILFVLLTDGRYFGKQLVYWTYDRLGPAVFATRSEGERWHTLLETIGLRGDERILDVGTALGDLPLSVAGEPTFRGEVMGIDWSPRMMGVAQREARHRGLADRARFEVVDVREGLPFQDGEFDVIFCLGLLETLPAPENILAELRRVLKAGGVIVLSLYRGLAATNAALSLKWYKKHLSTLGLGEPQVAACRGHHDVLIARRK
jgi:ubiquinone/menaquinone biosynthesis C-methylase UbiE